MPNSALTDKGITGSQIVAFAMIYQGTKYVYGGESPSGFDCSGFAQFVYNHFGISIPRTSQEQAQVGTAVDASNLQKGDLLFFNIPSEGSNSHEGIYVGGNKFIHAPHTGDVVHISDFSGYYRTYFSTARRIVTGGAGTTAGGSATPTDHALTRDIFAREILTGLGAPLSKNNLVTLVAWFQAEGTSATYNPLATGLDWPGATAFNKVVKNYPNETAGQQATVQTLIEPRYTAIRGNFLRSAAPTIQATVIEKSAWVNGDAGIGKMNYNGNLVTLVSQVAANYEKYGSVTIGQTSAVNDPGLTTDPVTGAVSGAGDAVTGAAAGAATATESVASALGRIADVFSWLSKGGNIVRIIEIIAGIIIIGAVLFFVAKGNIMGAIRGK